MVKRPRPPPPDDAAYNPRGGAELIEAALSSLQKFGRLRAAERAVGKESIFRIAREYNRLRSGDYKGPERRDIAGDLKAIAKAADSLSKALEGSHDVSLTWLTGACVVSGVENLWTPYRHLPAKARNDDPWRGPSALLDDREFAEAVREAFEPQVLMLGFKIKGRRERAESERAAALIRRQAAKTELESDAAAREFFSVKPEFDRRLDLTDPVAFAARKIACIAQLALTEFERQSPKSKGGRNVDRFGLGSAQDRLVWGCLEVVANCYGPSGFGMIKQTPNGRFGSFVKDSAIYATDRDDLGDTELDHAIKLVARQGAARVEVLKASGEDPFQAYHLAKKRFG